MKKGRGQTSLRLEARVSCWAGDACSYWKVPTEIEVREVDTQHPLDSVLICYKTLKIDDRNGLMSPRINYACITTSPQ